MILSHRPAVTGIDKLVSQIDALSDAARSKVTGDAARLKEYEIAAQEATEFRQAGYEGYIPASVASWAEAKGWTAQQAAESILEASRRFYDAMYAVRDARLKTKEAIKASKTYTEAEALFDAFKDNLDRILQGVA